MGNGISIMATNFSKVDRLVSQAMRDGLEALGKDVKKRAVLLAPKDSGDLRQSARVDVSTVGGKDMVEVSFNTPYARRRHWENYLHPSTKMYLHNGLKSITNVERYFPKDIF